MCAGCRNTFERTQVLLKRIKHSTYILLRFPATTCSQQHPHSAAKVSSLMSEMSGVSSSLAQQRADASWISGKSPDRCLLPVFEFLGLSASSCTLAPVPLQTLNSPTKASYELLPPQIIISSSNTPGITIIAPRMGSSRGVIPLSTTDHDG